jgi:hypothetical protein
MQRRPQGRWKWQRKRQIQTQKKDRGRDRHRSREEAIEVWKTQGKIKRQISLKGSWKKKKRKKKEVLCLVLGKISISTTPRSIPYNTIS